MTLTAARAANFSALPGWDIAADLTPPELVKSRRVKALRRLLAAGFVALLVACGGVYYLAARENVAAAAELATVQEHTVRLQAEAHGYSDVVSIQRTVGQVESQIAQVMAGDVDFAALMGALRSNLPTTMTIDQESIVISVAGVAAAESAATGSGLDSSGSPRIGTVTMAGTGQSLDDLADYIGRLRMVTGVVEVIPVSNTVSDSGTRYSITLGLTDALLSHRFDVVPGVSISAQDKRLWLYGGAIVALLIVLLGWFFVIQPELSDASSNREQAENARMQNIVQEGRNSRLKAQNDDVAALRAGLAAAVAELPYDSGLSEFTRQVSAQATENSMALSSVVVGNAQPVAAPTAEPGTSEQATAASTEVVAIPITLVATGTSSGQQAFLTAIQVSGPRRALVTAVQTAPPGGGLAVDDAVSTMTVQLTVFSDPLPPAEQAALEKLLSGG